LIFVAAAVAVAKRTLFARATADPPSCNDTAPNKGISDFVPRTTKKGFPDFVRPEEQIATFDNDGTLWARATNTAGAASNNACHRIVTFAGL